MDIVEELSAYLAGTQKEPGKPRLDGTARKIREENPVIRERNVEIVRSHFGFGSGCHFWPTLEQIAAQFPEISSRERIRQVINKTYVENRPASPLPIASRAAAILAQKPLWLESEYLEELQERGLCGQLDHAIGLLNYLQSQNLASDYSIYLPNLSKVTRALYEESKDRLIVSAEKARDLKKDLTAARKLPGRVGLAMLSKVRRRGANVDSDGLANLLRLSSEVWTGTEDGELWFFFEDRGNSLLNLAAKTFSITDRADIAQLSEVLTNALSRGAAKEDFPSPQLVERWLAQSHHFTVSEGKAAFNGKVGELTEIEKAIYRFATANPAVSWKLIGDHLRTLGFGDPLINASVYYSPLLVVDRSGGRGKFTFTLISELVVLPGPQPDRYASFLARLAALGSTDRESKGTTRREQSILAEWIFDGETAANCALCGQIFERRALVVAHKKKRRLCSDTERLDPYIVFPLCVFGCDYLYEHGYITVHDGRVSHGQRTAGCTEHQRACLLAGRDVDANWTRGPAHYFDTVE